ncbi:patatin-like phospholipase family protein [Sorangium sp. So ce134]
MGDEREEARRADDAADATAPTGETEPPRPPSIRRMNVVLEGGGVKGIALAGALQGLAEQVDEYNDSVEEFNRVNPARFHKPKLSLENARYAGTSAGAVIAALMASGYKPREIEEIIVGPDIARIADRGWLSRIPVIGKPADVAIGVLGRLGMFRGDYLLEFLRAKLRDKGVRTFSDLVIDPKETDPRRRYKLYITASDITRGRMLVLPASMNRLDYGKDPDELEVALAVRMSISVPFVFRPIMLQGESGLTSFIVDGGLLSNFPLQIFDPSIEDPSTLSPARPATIGIRILRHRYHSIRFPGLTVRALYALASTAIEAHDYDFSNNAIDELKWARSIEIDTEGVSVLRFNLTPLEKEMLRNDGYVRMKRTASPEFFEQLLKIERTLGRAVYEPAAGGPGGAGRPTNVLRHNFKP